MNSQIQPASGNLCPKVSVIIPTYQHADFVGEAINSVLAQAYTDYEIILVDDGSTDGTKQIAAAYGNQIRYIYQDNRGLSAARNTGIQASKGQYVSFLDADDVWLPNKLKLEVEFLDTHPSVKLVYSNYSYFGSRRGPKRTGFEGIPLSSGYGLKELFLNNPILPSAVLVRKSCFEKVGLFDESLVQCEDLDMWLRIAASFEIDYIDIPLAKYRLHDRNMHLETEGNIRGFIAMRRKCIESNKLLLNKIDLKTMREYLRRDYLNAGGWYLSNGMPQKARELFREYLRLYPCDPLAYMSWLKTFLLPRLLFMTYSTSRKWLLKALKKLVGPRMYEQLKGWRHSLKKGVPLL